MATTIQDKLTETFEQLATDAGLQFIVSAETKDRGWWLIMDDSDGLDTRLRVRYQFQPDFASFELSGQAVADRDLDFFKQRHLIRQNAGASNRARLAVQLRAEYDNGDQLRKVTGAVADLLDPYAQLVTEARPGESIASRREAEAELARRKLNRHSIALVLKRAYGHGSASFALVGRGDELGYLDYDRDSGRYSLRVPEVSR